MEAFLALVLVVLLSAVVLSPIGFALFAVKTRRRLEDAERRISQLESEAMRPRPREPGEEFAEEIKSEEVLSEVSLPPKPATPTAAPPPDAASHGEQVPGVFAGTSARPSAGSSVGSSPEPATGRPTEPPSQSPPSSPLSGLDIDWERWIGVRGAAVLGGVVLALAGVLFLKYSIEHGLIPPVVRVAIGVLVGISALVASERLRRRDYETVANSLAGASVVLFYASVWAARALYGLIPDYVAWGFMVLVTLACGLLSWRRRSLLVAVIGLLGGFATPLLLSTGENRPFSLFAYILLLDAGLILLARKRLWPLLASLSLAGTALYQVLWIGARMEPDQLMIALAILAAFALVYALAQYGKAAPADGEGQQVWGPTQAAGVLLPYLFAFYLAARADASGGLGEHLTPIAGLLILLSVLAFGLSRALHQPLLAPAAAAASVAVLALWASKAGFDDRLAWEASAIGIALALTFQLLQHLRVRRRGLASAGDEWAPLIATAGPLVVLLLAHLGSATSLWPWLAGWAALAALLAWSAGSQYTSRFQILGAAGLSLGFLSFLAGHAGDQGFPPMGMFLALAVGGAAAFQGVALWRRGHQDAEIAAAAAAFVLLAGTTRLVGTEGVSNALFFSTTLGLGLLLALSSTRLRAGGLLLVSMAFTFFGHVAWAEWTIARQPQNALAALVGCGLAVLVFTFWPFLAGRCLGRDRWALYSAALAGPVWFLPLQGLWKSHFGSSAIGILPVLLGAVSLTAAFVARARLPRADAQHQRSLVWFLAVALGFVSVAIPLQLDKEWITIAWALEGLALVALWKRLHHPGLKYLGLALLAAVSARLIANPAVLGYHPRARLPILNWLSYTYLVPAATLLASARILERLEFRRRRKWEERIYSARHAWGATACGLAAVLVIFVWINLTIFDTFSTGSQLQLSWDRHMARDLTLSLAWALFAMVLLAIGMARTSSGLRWVSLGFLILTIGKVFLHDLGELEDLYRVASLAGLAVSLIAVSLAYQRFVFGPDREARPTSDDGRNAR